MGHELKPVVMVGQSGLTEAIAKETDTALLHHELIKMRVRLGDRAARNQLMSELAARCEAELVQRIGNTVLLYRLNPEKPRIQL